MRGYYFFMDLSEFTPPARLSLTDQEISQRLGAATADEAGMIAAMDFLEEQTNLRDQDNRAIGQWIEKMENSDDPRAAIALQNYERAKQGLEPLPLVPLVPEYPVFNPSVTVAEPIETVETEPAVELGSAEEAAEEFEELLQEPVLETAQERVVEVVEKVEPEAETPDEVDEVPAPKVRGVKLVSGTNWVLGVGVLAPAFAASFAALLGLNFVTSMLAGLVGVLVGVKVNILALVTARRTKRGLAVSSRATFGVFGAILPGVLLLLAGLALIYAAALAAGTYFNNTIVGLGNFDDQLFTLGEVTVTFGKAFAVVLVIVAAILAIFGGAFARWFKISLSAFVLIGFVAFAVLPVSGIDYLNLAGDFKLDGFLAVAPLFALVTSVFAYGVDGESIAASSWGATRKNLSWPILVFGFLVPLLTYGHIAALLNGHTYETPLSVIQLLMTSGSDLSASIFIDVALVAVIGFLFVGVSKLIEALKTVGTNHIGYGSATLASAVTALGVVALVLLTTEPLRYAIDLTAILLIPGSFWVGAVATETVMRRGKYHDASLTRSYGFYGSVNWVAIVGFALAVTAGLGLANPLPYAPWLGYLGALFNLRLDIVLAALGVLAFAIVFTLATGFPRILRQQRETKAVEDRQYDLLNVVVD